MELPSKYVDYVGCFLPSKKTTFTDPNAQKFIRLQLEHPKTSHPDTMITLKNTEKLTPAPPKIVLSSEKDCSSQKQTKLSSKRTWKKKSGY